MATFMYWDEQGFMNEFARDYCGKWDLSRLSRLPELHLYDEVDDAFWDDVWEKFDEWVGKKYYDQVFATRVIVMYVVAGHEDLLCTSTYKTFYKYAAEVLSGTIRGSKELFIKSVETYIDNPLNCAATLRPFHYNPASILFRRYTDAMFREVDSSTLAKFMSGLPEYEYKLTDFYYGSSMYDVALHDSKDCVSIIIDALDAIDTLEIEFYEDDCCDLRRFAEKALLDVIYDKYGCDALRDALYYCRRYE